MTRALILGIGGQDGSYLADILLERGCEVHGLHRHSSVDNLARIAHCRSRLKLHRGDVMDYASLCGIMHDTYPNEVYNVADQDNVDWSFAHPLAQIDVTCKGVANLLDVLQDSKFHDVKVFQPVSATVFGDAAAPQDERTPLNPLSPYACAKAAAWHLCRYHRQVHGLWVCCGIMYNHDSPRRAEGYLLGKIAKAAVDIARGRQDKLPMGNLDQEVDVGHAKEYMRAAVSMMQLGEADDFVISSPGPATIKNVIWTAFKAADSSANPYDRLVKDDFHRPGPPCRLIGDSRKAYKAFGFTPKLGALGVVEELVNHHQGART